VVVRRWTGLAVVCGISAALAAGAEAPSAAAGPPAAPTATTATTDATSTTQPARLALVGRTAENWIYIDKPTLRRLTSDKYELWAQVRQSHGDTVKMLLQVNCADRSYLVKSSATYSEDGSVVDSYTPRSPNLQYIVPDSAAEYIHAAICKH
jgi:hypothetical protein